MDRPRLLAAAAALALAAPPAPRAAPADSPWGAAYFPNVRLVTQDGREVRFYDDLVKDRQVVVSFIFTHCTRQCGPMTANLARVQRRLAARPGKQVAFYSITMDPARDTPEVLRRYARAFKAGPGWTFLTGREEDVALLRRKFGDLAPVEDHAASVFVGNDAIGQWMTTPALVDPAYLEMVVADWLDPRWRGREGERSYADAPPVVDGGRASRTYREQCAMCHAADGSSVGPSLRGVTSRRDRAWLLRWMKDPGKMVADGDPVAVGLLARSGDVLMPSLDLDDAEIAALLDLLAAQDRAERAPP